MSKVVEELSAPLNLAELLARVGNVPARRILVQPPPGMATEKDVVAYLEAADKRLVELVDGVLVEKDMGWKESLLACYLAQYLCNYLDKNDLGIPLTADGPVRLRPKRIRIPDVCFIAWDRLPPDAEERAILRAIPNLAVEIISKGNTPKEMQLKLRDYFRAGVELVWLIYPKTETAEVYTSATEKKLVEKTGKLDGGAVLPGLSVSLKMLFSRVRRKGNGKR